MHIYTTKDGKFRGLQKCDDWTLQELQSMKEALAVDGRDMIIAGTGIVVCRECGKVIGQPGDYDGDIAWGLCQECYLENRPVQ